MKIKSRKAPCKCVLAIVRNQIEKFETIRVDTIPPMGDFPEDPYDVIVLRMPTATGKYKKFEPELHVGLETVIFLKDP